jgi:hypothetical protein
MRCLRCALDYPQEERYCHRCGRALSRPPGSKGPEESSQFSALPDTQYLYSTFSPPGAAGAVQERAELEGEVPAGTPPSPRAGLPPSASLARPSLGKRGEAPTPVAADHETADEMAQTAGRQIPPSLPGSVYIPPPTEPLPPIEPEVKLTRPVDDFDDEEDVLAAFRVKPAAIGADSGSWRKQSTRQRGMAILPRLPRQARLAIVAVVVLAIAGAVALWRHGLYATDVQDARRFAQAGQYPAAIGKYQAAIGAWPFNTGAKNGLAGVQATVTVVNATATAVAANAQAQATAVVERQSIYAARLQLREQTAAQADADANATATASASH